MRKRRPSQSGRELMLAPGLDDNKAESEGYGIDAVQVEEATAANLISSHSVDWPGQHLPTIDIDFPVRVVESSRGKSHLFIDKPMTWEQYSNLLFALVDAGVVEARYVEHCVREEASFVRLYPERKKRGYA